jgi:hypothetical protein
MLGSEWDKTARNTADVPERVEDTSTYTPVDGMGHLANVCGPRGRRYGDSKSQDESTAHEAAEIGACCLHTCTDHDDATANKHTPFSSSKICCRACDERSNEIANGIDGVHDASFWSSYIRVEAKVSTILLVVVDSTHERAIIAVDT